ncbi:MAG TPA: serine/threonine protein kinase [Planctomycetaceae bacterium]|nr:serine/threonine protein kinase [Planctomycetaceae bacterium]
MKNRDGADKQSTVDFHLGRTGAKTRVLLRRRIWIWPFLAALAMAGVGYWIRTSVESALKTTLADELRTLLEADVAALRIWLKLQESNVQTVADDRDVRQVVEQILTLAASPEGIDAALLRAPQLSKLREELQPWLDADDYEEFLLVNPQGRILASSRDELVGKNGLAAYAPFFEVVFQGKATVSHPIPSAVMLPDEDGQSRVGVPTMFAAAPVFDEHDRSVAALCLRLHPQRGFTQILQVARMGQTGETYAFDSTGLMLSESRFTDQLVNAGLIAERPVARSTLNLVLRDPGTDLVAGDRPVGRSDERPLTRMVASAIRGETGADVQGYRDYRGVMVVGAWTWLGDYHFGVANEVDLVEAYRPLLILRRAFWGLFGLLAAAALGLCVFSIVVARLQRSARRSALEARRLGQYLLDEKIGSGGMGVVYRGHHAMLRRPTAIKLLQVEKTTEDSVRRFEREVRLTCHLNHPNTIAIYDYGRTPEGLFYYAMEYLEGMTLQELVDCFGPQGEGRVIYLLQQICGSLSEAHAAGLVHRDIKPSNIMLNQRGGLFDFVKVLDFGLVRSAEEQQLTLTSAGGLTGTPLYMSPEAIERPKEVDFHSDLYAVGAVGYFLLTGQPVFSGQNVLDVCMQHFNAAPVRPSIRLGRPIAADLEDVLLRCLAKKVDDRPANARELAAELDACAAAGTWSQADAERWWREHSPTRELGPTITAAESRTANNRLLTTFVPASEVPPESA